jgi:hypothetical protein
MRPVPAARIGVAPAGGGAARPGRPGEAGLDHGLRLAHQVPEQLGPGFARLRVLTHVNMIKPFAGKSQALIGENARSVRNLRREPA